MPRAIPFLDKTANAAEISRLARRLSVEGELTIRRLIGRSRSESSRG
jgi:hypothetical protein